MSSAGDPSMSASTIVADTASGCHILKIDGYSHTKGTPTGEAIKSGKFTVGGYRWFINYYPNGINSDAADHVSFYLVLDDEQVTKPVKVQLRVNFASRVTRKRPITRADPVWSFTPGNNWGYSKFVKREDLERSEHLTNDAFTVRCDVVVINEIRTEDAPTVRNPFVTVPQSNLIQHLGDLLGSEKGADVVFEVGGDTFSAHRCVLAARSPVFSAELFGAMKEGGSGGIVRVADMEARVFKALLSFVYTDSLPETEEEDNQGAMFQHLLVAADRYDLGRLKLICEEKLCAHIDVFTAATILAIAEQHHCHGLKKACIEFLSTPAHMVAAMLTSGDFCHLRRSCPVVWMELIRMSVAPI
ncbi:hypothetical protein CFC21_081477 [Triticum aestivum]|uniref:BTB domain-containing protein n=2 Tax=Triticum aestivum TaxID=4565 RepID=A0A9R1I5B1_WHEAT|nr:hypothetical protein CFC21_081477 [Triticum aestivum]